MAMDKIDNFNIKAEILFRPELEKNGYTLDENKNRRNQWRKMVDASYLHKQ